MKLPDAVREQFRRYGRQGGRTRAARMSPEARRSVARRAGTARWIRQRFGFTTFEASGYPGGKLVDLGLAALADGEVTVESLVVSVAAPRLRREGIPLPPIHENAKEQLFDLLAKTEGELAHARYLAYLRRIVSFADVCRNERMKRARHAS